MALALCLAVTALAAVRADGSAQHDDAFVQEAEGGRGWTIGNGSLTYTLALDRDDLVAVGLGRGGDPVALGGGPDTVVTVNGEERPFGQSTAGFVFQGAEAADVDGGVLLTLGFRLRQQAVVLERHYKVYPGAPVIEMWTTVGRRRGRHVPRPQRAAPVAAGPRPRVDHRPARRRRPGRPVRTAAAVARAGRPGRTRQSRRCRPRPPSPTPPSPATASATSSASRGPAPGAPPSPAPTAAPPSTSGCRTCRWWRAPAQRLEFPHAFLGVDRRPTPAPTPRPSRAWLARRRGGRAFPALATFNTWFTHGIRIDADQAARRHRHLRRPRRRAVPARRGLVRRPRRPRPSGTSPPASARGRWTARRFPEGLGVLADYAHERGLKFGVWVEPERVAMTTVGRAGMAEERFLATVDGQYQPGTRQRRQAASAQICLSDARRAAVGARSPDRSSSTRPIPTTSSGTSTSGSAAPARPRPHRPTAATSGTSRGLYAILGELRARYPLAADRELLGRRPPHRRRAADARPTRPGWTTAAPRRRASAATSRGCRCCRPRALLSYVMSGEGEPMADAEDLRAAGPQPHARERWG